MRNQPTNINKLFSNQLLSLYRDNFPVYAEDCLHIKTKETTTNNPTLVLNDAQQYIHDRLEEQKRDTGKIRAIILKGRQQGCSTYVEARFMHNVTFNQGVNAFILTHDSDATQNLFDMAKRYYDYLPEPFKPGVSTANAKALFFPELQSGYRVGTAGSKGAGRSSTIQYFHGSEVAYWANEQLHMDGVVQAVPDLPGTEIILESTSNGAQGLFYDLAMDALKGIGDYQLIFVPWYVQKEYRSKVDDDFIRNDSEEDLVRQFKLDDEQLSWRRKKVHELRSVWMFQRVYPNTVEDAFNTSVDGSLWTEEMLETCRISVLPRHVKIVRIGIAIDPATTAKESSDETGIIGGALGDDGVLYVFKDVSGKHTPDEWGRIVVNLYHEYDANFVVGETNQGGDMVEHTIRSAEKDCKIIAIGKQNKGAVAYKGVRASKGKRARAEPVQGLYVSGMVKHLGELTGLEQQMKSWNAQDGSPSPDRVDALVWLATAMMIGFKKTDIWSV